MTQVPSRPTSQKKESFGTLKFNSDTIHVIEAHSGFHPSFSFLAETEANANRFLSEVLRYTCSLQFDQVFSLLHCFHLKISIPYYWNFNLICLRKFLAFPHEFSNIPELSLFFPQTLSNSSHNSIMMSAW